MSVGSTISPVSETEAWTEQHENDVTVDGRDGGQGGSSKLQDPIADLDVCQRDIKEFKRLGINAVRIYSVDNTKDHDACMSELADAGIYLMLDVNTPDYSINREDPHPSYNDVYLQHVFATVDAFAKYDNLMLFFSGNEVINDKDTTRSAPYVKAVTRDIRQYIRARGYRNIPVGYSAADVKENRAEMAAYMNCGSDEERSDFFAINDYSWCDPSSFTESDWDEKVELYKDYSIPMFLSEFGCIEAERQFREVASLYSTDMSSVFSGGLVYEYTEEGSGYGLVKINGDSIEELDDFETLRKAFSEVEDPSGDAGYKENGTPSQCPASRTDNWEVADNRLPAIPRPAEAYMQQGAGEGPGLEGAGSQTAGTPSSDTASPGTSTAPGTSSTSTGAASALRVPETIAVGPLVCALAVLVSSLLGTALI